MADRIFNSVLLCSSLLVMACRPESSKAGESPANAGSPIENKLAQYAPVRLTTDLAKLSENERRMIPLLIEAARSMDAIFWQQAYGNRDSLLEAIPDPLLRRYVEINYGPWDRLANNQQFVEGVGPKPSGAGFYPTDMTKEEFEAAARKAPALRSQYTMVRRDSAGSLIAQPYHEAFATPVARAVSKLREAARLADDPGFRRALEGKADVLGLYMITKLHQRGELTGQRLEDNYVTFLASIFRSIRFGASSAHGRANAAQFSFFEEQGAFTRDSLDGRYRVDFVRVRGAMDSLAQQILRFQGDGDLAGVTRFMAERGKLSSVLQEDLRRLGTSGIPVDIVFDQGEQILQ